MIICCIEEEPSERLTAEQAINHQVFLLQDKSSLTLTPHTDLSPLPTAALRFSPVEEDQQVDSDVLRSIREECQSYGEITDCKETFKLLPALACCNVINCLTKIFLILNMIKQCRG